MSQTTAAAAPQIPTTNMVQAERRARICEKAAQATYVRISELQSMLGVSYPTVIRDIDGLVRRGVLQRVRGGIRWCQGEGVVGNSGTGSFNHRALAHADRAEARIDAQDLAGAQLETLLAHTFAMLGLAEATHLHPQPGRLSGSGEKVGALRSVTPSAEESKEPDSSAAGALR